MMDPLALDTVVTVKPSVAVGSISSSTVYFLSERQRFAISDARVAFLIGLIDGRSTVEEILTRASCRLAEPEALYLLTRLVKLGHLVPLSDLAPEVAGYWAALGFDGERTARILRQTPVSVTALGKATSVGPMTEALAKAGITVQSDAPVRMVVTDDYLHGEIDAINRAALRQGTTWALAKPTGSQPLVGPVFRPGMGPCWECLAFYLRNNRPVEELLHRRMTRAALCLPNVFLETTLQTACGLAAVSVASALVSAATHVDHPLFPSLLSLDLAALGIETHRAIARPQCPVCGDPSLTAAIGEQPIQPRSVTKASFEDGGYRRQSPRRTHEAYQHLVSPIAGPVTHLVPVPGQDTEIRAVYASGYMVCPRDEIPTTNVFDRGCAGKGCSTDQARVSALCEALERFSGVYQGDEARLRATTASLGSQAVNLPDLLNFSEEQYRTRRLATGARVDARQWVPEPLQPSTEIDWAYGWSLSRNERRYVPFAFCYAESPSESGTAYCHPCGNGVAAGTCVEEALLQGLLELVERDAAAVWWYNRIPRPVFELASFRDSFIDNLLADYARLGWTVWVLDLSHDLRIPVAAGVAHHAGSDRIIVGFGCHLDARIAVTRALTELNQLFDPDGVRRSPWEEAAMPSRDYLFGDMDSAPTAATAFSTIPSSDLRTDLEACMQRLHAAGLEVVAVNKTRPDIGLSVVQTVVPGLRHFWPRFGPGRLYSVPCALGWRVVPLTEGELNPVPLLL